MVGYDQIPVAPRPSMPSLGLRSTSDRIRQAVTATSGFGGVSRVPKSVARVAQDERLAGRRGRRD